MPRVLFIVLRRKLHGCRHDRRSSGSALVPQTTRQTKNAVIMEIPFTLYSAVSVSPMLASSQRMCTSGVLHSKNRTLGTNHCIFFVYATRTKNAAHTTAWANGSGPCSSKFLHITRDSVQKYPAVSIVRNEHNGVAPATLSSLRRASNIEATASGTCTTPAQCSTRYDKKPTPNRQVSAELQI